MLKFLILQSWTFPHVWNPHVISFVVKSNTSSTACVPFRSTLSMWGLSLTAWATTSAAASVISPNERLRSWKEEAWQRCSQTVDREHRCFWKGQSLRETSPGWWEVLLWGLLQGRWLLQSAQDSRRSWSPARFSDASEPARLTGRTTYTKQKATNVQFCA